MENLKNKVILTVAHTGAWPQKSDTPYVPLTPEEIADDVYECWEAGASVSHIHVRNEKGKAAMTYDNFEKAVNLIRDRCDIVINLTTSGGIGLTEEERMMPFVKLRPEIASYDCGSMNWMHSAVFENHPKFLEQLGKKMNECNVKPEIEVFDAGMVYNALYYLKKGILEEPLHFQFVLGAPGGMNATIQNLVFLKSLIPPNSTWGALGIGKGHLPILYTTLALGGNVRVGMEDNIFYAPGRLAVSNTEFVERTKRIVTELGKEIATPDETRQILNLKNYQSLTRKEVSNAVR